MSKRFKTGTAAKSAGIAPALLRMWESRYGLVRPTRGPGGQRLYSENDVAVLRAVSVLIRRGYAIGELSSWSNAELLSSARELAAGDAASLSSTDVAPANIASVSSAVILALDHHGVINAVSPSVESLLGWPHTLLVGLPVWGLLIDVPAQLEQYVRGVAGPAEGLICWVWMRTRTGDSVPCRVACGRRRAASEGTSLSVTITSLYGAGEAPLSTLLPSVVSEAPPERLFADYVTSAVEHHDAALARVWTYDARQGTLHLTASCGLSKAVTTSQRSVIRLSSYRFKVGVVARTGIPYLHNDLESDRDFDRRWIKKERLHSAAVMPLVHDGKLYGVTAMFFRKRLGATEIGKVQAGVSLCEAALRRRPR